MGPYDLQRWIASHISQRRWQILLFLSSIWLYTLFQSLQGLAGSTSPYWDNADPWFQGVPKLQALAAFSPPCAVHADSRGITIFAVSRNGGTHQDIMEASVLAALGVIGSSAVQLPRALITDLNVSSHVWASFDCVIVIDDDKVAALPFSSPPKKTVMEDQAWKGLWFLPLSPFRRTIAVLRQPAGPFANATSTLPLLDDFALVLPPSNAFPYIDVGLIAFRKGAAFESFHETLKRVLPFGSAEVAVDLVARTMGSSQLQVGLLPLHEGPPPQPFADHSRAHHHDYYDRIDRLEQRLQGMSYGVSFFGYSTDAARLVRYLERVEKTAWGLKMFNPRIKVALFTNQENSVAAPPFDHIVRMANADIKPACCKRNETWNILARVQYHKYSPYDLTVQIDSDRVIYDDISDLFELLADGWDLLGVSGGDLPNMDLGVLGYKNSPKVGTLLSAWVEKMKELKHEGLDDQYSFTRVRDTVPGLKVGFLSPNWQMKYTPPKPLSHHSCNKGILSLCNVTYTLPITGPVKIAAGSYETLETLITRANELNQNRHITRMYVHDLLDERYIQVSSKAECDKVTRKQCNHPEFVWDLPVYDVLNITQAQGRFPGVKWKVD